MSGKEVAGLQALAMAHGGSLTINPTTGLPEAGFLDDILPVLAIGAGLYFGGGALGMLGETGGATALGEAAFTGTTPTGLATVAGDAGSTALTSAAAPAGWTQTASGMYALPGEAGTATGLLSGLPSYALPAAGGVAALSLLNKKKADDTKKTIPMIRPSTYNYNPQTPTNMIGSKYQPGQDTSERQWFNGGYTYGTPYEAADGGIIALAGGGMAAGGGPVELMSNQAALGANTMYPMANMSTSAFATPYQDPKSTNMMSSMAPSGGGTVNAMSGEPNMQGTRLAAGGVTGQGGINLNIPLNIGSGGAGGFGGGGGNQYPFTGQQTQSPGYQQMQQMNQPQGYGPRGPANFSPDYLAAMASVRGQSAGAAPNGIAQETPIPGQPGYAINTMAQGPAAMQAMGGFAAGGMTGGISNLGGYSDGGRLLRGPGDGVSDSIPAQIGNKQPARLADGEFVVPARIVSELGNGSTEAGAKQLYKMLDRVQNARAKTTAKGKVAHNNNPAKLLPA
jgi:hypothetical protein